MAIVWEPRRPIFLNPKNVSIEENFSFNGKPVKAGRFYNNYPAGSFFTSFTQLPSQSIEAVSWSPRGRLVSFACSGLATPETTSSMATFYYTGPSFAYAPSPTSYLPGSWVEGGFTDGADAYAIEWSPDGKKLAVGSSGSYKVNIYSFNEGLLQFSNILQPTPPENFSDSAICTDVSWSPDSTLVAASFSEDPFVYIFRVLDESFELFASLDQNYSIGANSCRWSPDGRYLCVGYSRTPYIGIYEFNGSNFNKLPDANTLPPAYVNKVAWSPDGTTLAVAHAKSPALTVYSFDGKRLKRIVVEHDRPEVDLEDDMASNDFDNDAAYDLNWSSDGRYLSAAFTIFPRLYIYTFDGKKLEKIHHKQPGGTGDVCAWSPDGEVLISGTNYATSGLGNAGSGPMLKLESPKNKPV